MLGEPESALCVQAEPRRCPAAVNNPPRPAEPLWPFHQLAGSISSVQMEHGCFPSCKETDNAGAVASLSIPLTCRRKIPSLPKHSKPDSPDVGKAQAVESLKPVSVTSWLYGFTSEIAPGLNIAKELKSLSMNSRQWQIRNAHSFLEATLSYWHYRSCLKWTEKFLSGRWGYGT